VASGRKLWVSCGPVATFNPSKQEAKGGSDEAQNLIVLSMSNELLYLVPKFHTHIFRFRSYLITDIGRLLVAKGEVMNFREAYRTWWANALVKDTPRDCTVVIEGVGAR
jgi:hypothetical protein